MWLGNVGSHSGKPKKKTKKKWKNWNKIIRQERKVIGNSDREEKDKELEMWIRKNTEWRKQTEWHRFCDHLRKRHLYHWWLSHHQAVLSFSPLLSVTQKALHAPFLPLCTIMDWHMDGVYGKILGALQLMLYVGIHLGKGSQGRRRELVNDSKVLCIISSSGNCHEMSSYGFGDLTLVSPSTDLAAKWCPILYCQNNWSPLSFLMHFAHRKEMV